MAISVLLLAPAAVARAAEVEGAGPAASSFGERIEVSVVNVEVFVTDRKGNPVSGLGVEDFELFEDGKPVPIANFYVVEPPRGPAAPEAVPAPAPPAEPAPPGESAATAEPTPEPRPTYLILYVDQVNLQPASRKRAFRHLREFLTAKLEPGTPVMVVSYDRSLRVALPFTAELPAVFTALERLERQAPPGVEAQAARRRTLIQIRSLFDDQGCDALDAMLAFAQAFARPRHHDVEAGLGALTRLADALAGLPGRKVLLHVSDGLPLVAGQEAYELIDELCPTQFPRKDFETTEFRSHATLARLTSHANADGVTLYALEAIGLQGPTSASADMPQSTLSARMDFNAVANHQDTLFAMADDTGGRALLNSNRLDRGLAKVAADLAAYYSLGFEPRHLGDGRVHALEVRVRRPDLEVRHRKSYRDKPAAERAEERLFAALILGREENPLGARLEAGAAAAAEAGLRRVPLRLAVPFPSLALLPTEAGREARLRLSLVARDDAGGSTPVRRVEVPVRVPEADFERALAREFAYELRLTFRPGSHRLALGVEDAATGIASYLALDLEVPAG